MKQVIQPAGWPKPKGYANGIVATGRTLYVGGQVGWDTEFRFGDTFAEQFGQVLDNIIEIVRTAGGTPEDVVQMTVFITDVPEYHRALPQLGAIWRERFGTHYPAMAMVAVAGLVEPRAKLEVTSVAVLPEESK